MRQSGSEQFLFPAYSDFPVDGQQPSVSQADSFLTIDIIAFRRTRNDIPKFSLFG